MADEHIRLSPRERQVLQLICEGQSSKQIAGNLKVSFKTITTHRSRILQKVGVHDTVSLFRWALGEGLIGGLREGASEAGLISTATKCWELYLLLKAEYKTADQRAVLAEGQPEGIPALRQAHELLDRMNLALHEYAMAIRALAASSRRLPAMEEPRV